MPSKQKIILHIDMNSYFASVEQQANPFLRGKPVGVCAYLSPNGCIIASSAEAKAKGIKTGCTVSEAKRLDPNVVLIENEPAKYRSTTEKIFSILGEYTDTLEPYSIDEAFLDLTGWGRANMMAVEEYLKKNEDSVYFCEKGLKSPLPPTSARLSAGTFDRLSAGFVKGGKAQASLSEPARRIGGGGQGGFKSPRKKDLNPPYPPLNKGGIKQKPPTSTFDKLSAGFHKGRGLAQTYPYPSQEGIHPYTPPERGLTQNPPRPPFSKACLPKRQDQEGFVPPGCPQAFYEAILVALVIRERIKKEVGEWMNCSIGISWTKFLAKFASDIAPKKGIMVIREDHCHFGSLAGKSG